MSRPLPASGLASDLGGDGPATPLEAFVDEHGPAPAAPPAPAPTTELLLFSLEGADYAVPVQRLREVTRAAGIARVPLAPRHVRGVQNVRGAMLPVLELRTRLGLPELELDGRSRSLVVEARGRLLALLVDSVHRVVRVGADQVRPPPPEVAARASRHVQGVLSFDQRLALVLDLDGVLALRDDEPTQEPA